MIRMVLQSNMCFYTKSSKCYWLIALLVCLNFWLISRLNLPKSDTTNITESESKLNVPRIVQPSRPSQDLLKKDNGISKCEKHDTDEVQNIFKSELIDVNLGRFDSSRKFKMFDNVIVGEKYLNLSIEYDVTLATQSSLDKLHWISRIVRMWSGPISTSVFVPEVEMDAARIYIAYLRKCDKKLREQVTFHFMFPFEKTPLSNSHKAPIQEDNISINMSRIELQSIVNKENFCSDTNQLLKKIFSSESFNLPSFQKWRSRYPFPQNHMRNLARKGSQTNYVFLTDIDIIPSPGLARNLSRFLNTNTCSKCAYVIIPYEVKADSKFPRSKERLKQLIEKRQARLFHQKVFSQNQFASNASMFEMDQDDSVLHVSHDAKYEIFYEPFYVSLDTAPPHDERFLGYGFTRNSQVMEMALDGWTFLVLSPAYAIHWGFQEKSQQNKLRKMQVNKNRRRFTEFEKEVRARYGVKNGKVSKTVFEAKKKISKHFHDAENILVGTDDKTSRTNKNNDSKSKQKSRGNSRIRVEEFQPVTKPDFPEDDMGEPKFSDDIV